MHSIQKILAIGFLTSLNTTLFPYITQAKQCSVLSSFAQTGKDNKILTFKKLDNDAYWVKTPLTADGDGAQNAYHISKPALDTLCNGVSIRLRQRVSLETKRAFKIGTLPFNVKNIIYEKGDKIDGIMERSICKTAGISTMIRAKEKKSDCSLISSAECSWLKKEVQRIQKKGWDQSETNKLSFIGIASKKHENGKYNIPCIQGKLDPFPGYFVSQTATYPALNQAHRDECNPKRYLDANEIPYIVAPNGLAQKLGLNNHTELMGKLVYVHAPNTNRSTYAIIGDKGTFGEGSLALGWFLNDTPKERRTTHYTAAVPETVNLLIFPKISVPISQLGSLLTKYKPKSSTIQATISCLN